MKRGFLVVCGFLLAGAAMAAGPAAMRKRVEASMLVTGNIVVAPDGSVAGYVLDKPEDLPAPVVALIGKNLPRWRFQPVLRAGKPVRAKASMSLRLVAKPIAGSDGNYALTISGTHFGDRSSGIGYKSHSQQPAYPGLALKARVDGTVYLLLKIDRQGSVTDALAQQVNIGMVGDDHEMNAMREVFANSALRAAKTWTFTVAATDTAEYQYARIPVQYSLRSVSGIGAADPDHYGQWRLYVPGPPQVAPWFDADTMVGNVDALPDGGIYDARASGPQLLTAPSGS